MKVAFLVQKIGPYHHARLSAYAALRQGELHVIEFRPEDTVYAWAAVRQEGCYTRSQTRTVEALRGELEKIDPQAIVCVGYADREISSAVSWAMARRVPLVTCSDSTYEDEPRSSLKEMFKRQVLRSFEAGLVAGQRARTYLSGLGLKDASLFSPWDVVDNDYFHAEADRVRANEAELRARFNLPEKYFLCVARFVAKKNLKRFIGAYGDYVRQTRGEAWSLVLSGSGPLEFELREVVREENLGAYVRFPGFLQYDRLPTYYALSRAFVLPSVSDQWGLVVNEAMASGLPVLVSNRCGCAPDLVQEEGNGLSFDPHRTDLITQSLATIAGLDDRRLQAMGKQSRAIIGKYSPEKFAVGLAAAIECSIAHPRDRVRWLPRLIAQSLALRPIPS